MTDLEIEIYITDHAYDRMKERLGWNRKAAARMAKKAFEEGVEHKDTVGSLHRYLDYVYLGHCNANQMRIYGEALFIFYGNRLITVYALPTKYRRKKYI